jgi:tetratricopeptide (TPR) repeat protein
MMRSPGCPFYREFTAPVLVVVGLALLLTSLLGNTLHAAALINLGSLELSRARLNADQESADPALNSFLKAERVAPTLVGVPRQELRLVQAHLVLGDMSSATAASESITSTAAERRMAFALLGDAYLMRGDAKQAVIALQQVGAVLQLADLGSKALRERNPDLAIQAWQAAQRVWARRGEVGPYEAQEAIEVHYGLAQIWIEQGDTDAALREYKALIQLLPENPTTYWQIGDLYRVQGKYELANEWLQKARALSPGSYRPYYHLGLLAADQGQWDVAASWQRKALYPG